MNWLIHYTYIYVNKTCKMIHVSRHNSKLTVFFPPKSQLEFNSCLTYPSSTLVSSVFSLLVSYVQVCLDVNLTQSSEPQNSQCWNGQNWPSSLLGFSPITMLSLCSLLIILFRYPPCTSIRSCICLWTYDLHINIWCRSVIMITDTVYPRIW